MKYISLLLFCSLLTFGVSAQSHSLTAGVGIFNPKLRVQFEHSLNSNKSAGANLTYYLDNWKGPRLEGFYRFYFSDFFGKFNKRGTSASYDNENGFYHQFKVGVGLFTNVFDDGDDLIFTYYDDDGNLSSVELYESNNWINFGIGSATGYKFTSNGGFVFEATSGLQIWSKPWSGPKDNYKLGYQYFGVWDFLDGTAANYYIIGPGFPLDLQIKFGFKL
jgi:hypothetical protein